MPAGWSESAGTLRTVVRKGVCSQGRRFPRELAPCCSHLEGGSAWKSRRAVTAGARQEGVWLNSPAAGERPRVALSTEPGGPDRRAFPGSGVTQPLRESRLGGDRRRARRFLHVTASFRGLSGASALGAREKKALSHSFESFSVLVVCFLKGVFLRFA